MEQYKESKLEPKLFDHFAWALKWLERIGIFPLALTSDGRQFICRKSSLWKGIFLVVLVFGCLLIAAYLGFYDTPNIVLIGMNVTRQMGLSKTDFVAFFIVYPVGFYNIIFHALEMRRVFDGLNEVIRCLSTCCQKLIVTQKDLTIIYKDTRCILVGFLISLVGAWACFFLFQYKMAEIIHFEGKEISSKFLYAALWSIGTIFGMCAPNQMMSIFLSIYIVNIIDLCMERLLNMIKQRGKEPLKSKNKITVVPISNKPDLNSVFPKQIQTHEVEELGKLISQVLEDVNELFGPLFFMNLGYSFVCIIVFNFCAINLILPIFSGNFNLPSLAFGCQCLFLLMHASNINERLHKTGQKLKDTSRKLGQAMSDLYLEDYDLMTKVERARFKDVRNRFQNVTPIRPYNFIDLDINTYLAATGLITTYVIVLLQFKIGEGGPQNLPMINATSLNNTS